MLSEKTKDAILKLQSQYPKKRSALIPALHLAQAEYGYLPMEAQQDVADLFDIAVSEVHALVTFYDMFFEEPVGKHILHVCNNASCMLLGSESLLEKFCHKLKIQPGETTEDGQFTVIPSECLAACDRGPVVIVDGKVIGPVKDADIDGILSEAKKGPGHPSPVSLPEGTHA